MDGDGVDDHEQYEDGEIGRELADQGGERTAAGRLHPFAKAARAELRSDGVARGYGDHDMQHGGQDRAQQELGIVQRGVGQYILFDHQRTGRVAGRAGHPGQVGDGG